MGTRKFTVKNDTHSHTYISRRAQDPLTVDDHQIYICVCVCVCVCACACVCVCVCVCVRERYVFKIFMHILLK
jgi:hypothetical protein